MTSPKIQRALKKTIIGLFKQEQNIVLYFFYISWIPEPTISDKIHEFRFIYFSLVLHEQNWYDNVKFVLH